MNTFKQTFFIFMLSILVSIPQAHAQQPANRFALEHFKQSLNFLMKGDYENAVNSCNQLIRLDPNTAVNYIIRARAFYELNNFDRTIDDCTQAIRLDRNNSSAYAIRGNAYRQIGNYSRAIEDWEMALRLNPENREAMHNIELARRQMNN